MKIDDPSAEPGRWVGSGKIARHLIEDGVEGESQNKFMNAIGRSDLAQI